DDAVTIPYTEFKQQVANGNVRAIYSQGQKIEGSFVKPVQVPTLDMARQQPRVGSAIPGTAVDGRGSSTAVTARNFNTLLPDFVDPGFETFLIEHNVEIRAV